MFLYTEKYTGSDKDIQNNNLLYKIHQQRQNTFQFLDGFGKNRKKQKEEEEDIKHSFWYLYKLHNSYSTF